MGRYFRLKNLFEVSVGAAQKFGVTPTCGSLTCWSDLLANGNVAHRLFPFGQRFSSHRLSDETIANRKRPGYLCACAPTVVSALFKHENFGMRLEPVPAELQQSVGAEEGLYSENPIETEQSLEQNSVQQLGWLYYAGFNFGFNQMVDRVVLAPATLLVGVRAGREFYNMISPTPLIGFYKAQEAGLRELHSLQTISDIVRLS